MVPSALSILGGAPPLSYNWSNGRNTLNINNLEPGSYSLTVTDAEGCEAVFGDFLVGEPDTFLEAAIQADSTSCYGVADGAIEADITGGNAPYSIEWYFEGMLIPTPDTSFLDNLEAGMYRVILRDSNNCVREYEFDLPEPENILISISISPPVGQQDGMATATVSGGTPDYTFLWSNGDTTSTIAVMEGGYELTVTDADGCQATASITVSSSFEAELVQGAQLFPNPTSGDLWLNLELKQSTPLELYVQDAMGRLWNHQPLGIVRKEQLQVNTRGLPAGIYWLSLRSEGRLIYSGRFVIQ